MTPRRFLPMPHGLRVRPTLRHHLEGVCAPLSQATLVAQAAAAAAAAAQAHVEAVAALERAHSRVQRARAINDARATRTEVTDVQAARIARALAAKKAGASPYLPPLVVDGQVLDVKRLD